ncbi:hypothetical protein [Curtobacterium sp. MCBD17_040]|uniref:hypothetical protein n=1 Tax=Curtobacterium sp. MCBD17_040 TaxID=2175674 RepID=UPI0011B7F08F|nr:hypothetical protein [Curtobacterium sp. MCBD17_040]WIB65355.1 hypothetical protein DEI94_18280 [Curtobacterium sp. MCBD17_040]
MTAPAERNAMKPEKHQIWKRLSTGELVTVTAVGAAWEARRTVVVQGKRRVYVEYGPFLKKYAFVQAAPEQPPAAHTASEQPAA